MTLLDAYVRELRLIRSSGAGVPELTYYVPFAELLNAVGKTLKPKVRCLMSLQNRGAGLPDGGLFTPDQFQRQSENDPLPGQRPSRGVIEIKPVSADAWVTADGNQVSRYWGEYRQVLVTNCRDFVLVGQDADGRPAKLETYRLAESEADFWVAAAQPAKLVEKHGDTFIEFLKRVMLHAAPLASPKDVAWFLASYARDAKARVEAADLPALASIRTALEEALGLKFEGAKGEHFFRSTLVQTLFYGIFSAWILWSKQPGHGPGAHFDWRTAAWHLRVPMIRALFEQVATPTQLGPLGLEEVLDWTGAVLDRVDRTAFFSQFEEGHAVQYFYEPFLEAYDPELRKQLGVWYTPPEIVQYMVARTDTVLREELGIEDGLADPSVYVLDPCCGTGTYLVEVLNRISATLKDKGTNGLLAHQLKRAAMERVFGFEILPAPFVVAHLQLGLLLQQKGAPLSESRSERVGVFLTNSLTGWEPPDPAKDKLAQLHLAGMPQLQEERDAAEKVKRKAPILVVLGNPPYNAYAGVSPTEEHGIVEPYKVGLVSTWNIKKFNLDDLYVRFFRLAERRIAEQTGRGVVCYISNHSWISDPSFVVLRQHLLSSFDRFWIENMHGDRKVSEYAPDGKTSETIFATTGFSPGIRQGVAISLWVKSGKQHEGAQVLFRNDLNAAKAAERREQLLDSLKEGDFDAHYEHAKPDESNRFSFRPTTVTSEYRMWPAIDELPEFSPMLGVLEKRRDSLISIDRCRLEQRMQMYFDPKVDWDTLRSLGTGLTRDAARFDAKKGRSKLQAGGYDPSAIRRTMARPMDQRWCYHTLMRPLWNEPRPRYVEQCWQGNSAIVTRRKAVANPEGLPFFFTSTIGDEHAFLKDAYYIPVRLRDAHPMKANDMQASFLSEASGERANLSPAARAYLASLGIDHPDIDGETATLLWMHALAIGYSQAYSADHADAIRQDWPRLPLPNTREGLLASATLGRRVAALLNPETPVKGVTTGNIYPVLRTTAVPASTRPGGILDPDAGDLNLTAGWGHPNKEGGTMPGKGRLVPRTYAPDELAAIETGPLGSDCSAEEALLRLGRTTYDVYLNDVALWRNVPANVWDFTIGGYQVIKKWLSYREKKLLGRSMTPEEVHEVTDMARRLTAILMLQPELDRNYRQVKSACVTWPIWIPKASGADRQDFEK